MYFLDLTEDARQWVVFVETPTGARRIPVYVDTAPLDGLSVLVEDKERRKLVN